MVVARPLPSALGTIRTAASEGACDLISILFRYSLAAFVTFSIVTPWVRLRIEVDRVVRAGFRCTDVFDSLVGGGGNRHARSAAPRSPRGGSRANAAAT